MLVIPATSRPGQVLASILTGICAMIGHHAVRSPIHALLGRIHWYLWRTATRLDRLALRWQAGKLSPPRTRPTRATTPAKPPPADAPPKPPRLPTRDAWLIRLVQPTAQFAGQIEVFLADPDTRALLAAAPQAGRLLRPLCRALGFPAPPWLRLPPRPPRTRLPRKRKSRLPAPAPVPPGTPDRPLPAYVRAAVRAWRKNSD
ncbi:MAG: hypothetical protein IT555_13580 [Acetobacteraceae bacterium]|nr:hypothetical protein [Acetobacteraceae bacterium]